MQGDSAALAILVLSTISVSALQAQPMPAASPLERLDTNGDGKISAAEFAVIRRLFLGLRG